MWGKLGFCYVVVLAMAALVTVAALVGDGLGSMKHQEFRLLSRLKVMDSPVIQRMIYRTKMPVIIV